MQTYREQLCEKIRAYTADFPSEGLITKRFIDLISEHPECFERTFFIPGHITASAWLVNRAGTHVLLTHHRKLNKWLQLGGHTDGNQNTLQSTAREAVEESGIEELRPYQRHIFDLDIHAIPSHKNEPDHEHFDVRYAFICSGNEEFVVSDESHDLKWVPITQIRKYSEERSMNRMASKWLQMLANT